MLTPAARMASWYGTDKLVLLFNCFCRAPAHLSGRQHTDRLLGTAFGLDATWPQHVRCAHLVDYRKLTIALAPGYSADDRSANVMVIVLAVVRAPAAFDTLTLCGAVTADSEVRGLHRSSVVLVRSNVTRCILHSWSPTCSHSIDELVNLKDMCKPIMAAFGNAAEALGAEIARHALTRQSDYSDNLVPNKRRRTAYEQGQYHRERRKTATQAKSLRA